ALADLDRDQDLDVVVIGSNTDHATSYVGVLAGTASRTPSPVATTQVQAQVVGGLDVGDVDHDGKLDGAIGSFVGLATLVGDGTGRLAAPSFEAGGGQPAAIRLADVDRDGTLDRLV